MAVADDRWYDPQKRFMEELILRFERVVRTHEKSIDVHTQAITQLTREIEEHRREFREEYEAQRGTLLAILDRLDVIDPRDGPAAAG